MGKVEHREGRYDGSELEMGEDGEGEGEVGVRRGRCVGRLGSDGGNAEEHGGEADEVGGRVEGEGGLIARQNRGQRNGRRDEKDREEELTSSDANHPLLVPTQKTAAPTR